jgi:hypothetical protein
MDQLTEWAIEHLYRGCIPEQVFNGLTDMDTLLPVPPTTIAPASNAAADAVKAAWLPLLPYQAVPMLGEVVPELWVEICGDVPPVGNSL